VGPWDQSVTTTAAIEGHLEVLQWARANGCDWDEQVTLQAACRSHLHVFKWAVLSGCKCRVEQCLSLTGSSVIEWLRSCPLDVINNADDDDDDDDGGGDGGDGGGVGDDDDEE
jgi:hypothetical protein